MTGEERALLMMAEQSTHTIGSGVTISERRDQEVGLNRIRNCPRNRERYTPLDSPCCTTATLEDVSNPS